MTYHRPSYNKEEVLRSSLDIRGQIQREQKAAKIRLYRQQLAELRVTQARCGWLSADELRRMEEAMKQLTALTGKAPL